MQKLYKAIELEAYSDSVQPTGNRYVSGDRGVYPIDIVLYMEKEVFKIPDGATATINFRHLGTNMNFLAIADIVRADQGKIHYDIIGNEIALSGEILASVEIQSGEKRLTWQRFSFYVEGSLNTENSVAPEPFKPWTSQINAELSEIRSLIGGGGGSSGSSPVLKSYITEALPGYLRETRQSIEADTVVGLFLTDTHTNTSNAYELQNMYLFAELMKELNPCFAAHLGNYLSDSSTGGKITGNKNDWLDTVNGFLKPIKNMKNQVFALRGNHDLNLHNVNDSTQLITAKDFYSTVVNPFKDSETYTSGDGLYCYKDFDDLRLRVICLDALDVTLTENGGAIENPGTFGFKTPQLNWLANEALDPTYLDNYSVIVLCHIPPTEELMYFDPSSAVPIRNSELLAGILNAFKTGGTYSGDTTGDNPDGGAISVTFSGAGNLIAYIHGHIHADNMHVPSGINFQVVSLNSGWAKQRTDTLPEGATSPARVPDTLSGVCVTAMTYSASTGDVKFHRIGVEMEESEFDDDEYVEPVIPPTVTHAINFNGGKGVIPFGSFTNVGAMPQITAEIKFNDVSGTQYFLCADTPGQDRRYFVGSENGRIFYGFGDQGKTSGNRVFEAGKHYTMQLKVIADGAGFSVYIREDGVDSDFVFDGDLTSASGNFIISEPGGFVLARNANNQAEYFKGRIYVMEFQNLAFYACNQTQGSVIVDASGYERDIVLSGSYSWVNRD